MGLVPPRPILPQRDLPISPYTGEPYDPAWGYQVYAPKSHKKKYGIVCGECYQSMPSQEICQFNQTCEHCGAFNAIPLDTDLISNWTPPRKPINLSKLFPYLALKIRIQHMMLAIGSWFLHLFRNIAAFTIREDDDLDSIRWGYQPTDTPPHRFMSGTVQDISYQPTYASPPQGGSVIAPIRKDGPFALDDRNWPIHPENFRFNATMTAFEPLPAPMPTYDIVMPDEYVVEREEDESQKIEALPEFDERLMSFVER